MMQGQDVLTCLTIAHNNYQKTSICEVFLLDMISNPVTSELLILPKSGDGSAVSLPQIHCRDTALPSPLLYIIPAQPELI